MLFWHFFRHFILSNRAGALIKRIAWLSFIGITLSVSAFLVVLFVMNGMNASIQKRILGLEPHLNVQVSGVTSIALLESTPVYQRIKERAENRSSIFESQDVILRSQDGQFRGGIARGLSLDSLQHFMEQLRRLDKGSLNENDNSHDSGSFEIPGEGEVVVGTDLAQSLGVFEGDFITVVSPTSLLLPPGENPKFERVRIKRIISTNLADLDSQYIFYQKSLALNLLANEGTRKAGIEIFLADGRDLDEMAKDLLKFSDVIVETWKDRNSALLYALKLEKLTIGTFLGLAGMIAASSILTVLSLLLSQKKSDIAILRTIGLSEKNTVRTFTNLGFVLSFSAVLLGIFLGTGISLYIQSHPIHLGQSQVYYDPSIPALVDYGLVLGVFILSALICWVGSLIPSRVAIELGLTEALRMK